MEKMTIPGFRVVALHLAVLLLFTGCAKKQMNLTKTGFLNSYADLQEEKEYGGMQIYRNPSVNIKDRYSKILIAPVQFRLDPTLKQHALDNEEREFLADHFQKTLSEGLVRNFEIVSEPGPDVLLLRTAITDIMPNKVLLNIHWSTTLLGAGIGGASLEAEIVDSISGERILAFVDARKGKSAFQEPKHLIQNYAGGLTKWGHTKEVIEKWAGQMVLNLEQLRAQFISRTAEAETRTEAEL